MLRHARPVVRPGQKAAPAPGVIPFVSLSARAGRKLKSYPRGFETSLRADGVDGEPALRRAEEFGGHHASHRVDRVDRLVQRNRVRVAARRRGPRRRRRSRPPRRCACGRGSRPCRPPGRRPSPWSSGTRWPRRRRPAPPLPPAASTTAAAPMAPAAPISTWQPATSAANVARAARITPMADAASSAMAAVSFERPRSSTSVTTTPGSAPADPPVGAAHTTPMAPLTCITAMARAAARVCRPPSGRRPAASASKMARALGASSCMAGAAGSEPRRDGRLHDVEAAAHFVDDGLLRTGRAVPLRMRGPTCPSVHPRLRASASISAALWNSWRPRLTNAIGGASRSSPSAPERQRARPGLLGVERRETPGVDEHAPAALDRSGSPATWPSAESMRADALGCHPACVSTSASQV